MKRLIVSSVFVAAFGVLSASPAWACGDGEAPISCDAENAGVARWMLKRVVDAVKKDEPGALSAFAKGQGGFRTADIYVFCMDAEDGKMSAHPDPKLMGQDARALVDPKGKHFAAEMLDVAQPDKVAEVNYLFPRPGGEVPMPKTSYVTRVADQVCGVGYYDLTRLAEAEGTTPIAQAEKLQVQLDGQMPTALRSTWRDFLKALDEERANRKAFNGRLLEQVKQIEDVLGKETVASRN